MKGKVKKVTESKGKIQYNYDAMYDIVREALDGMGETFIEFSIYGSQPQLLIAFLDRVPTDKDLKSIEYDLQDFYFSILYSIGPIPANEIPEFKKLY